MIKHQKIHREFEVAKKIIGVSRFSIFSGIEERTSIKCKTILHCHDEVEILIEAYLRQAALNGDFFIEGTVVVGTYLSVRSDEESEKKKEVKTQREPGIIYSGSIDPRKASRMIIEEFLIGLASTIAHTLKQDRAYLWLNDEKTIIQRRKSL